MHAYILDSLVLFFDTQPRDLAIKSKDGGKISPYDETVQSTLF